MTDYRDKAHNQAVEVVIVPAWQTVAWGGVLLGAIAAIAWLAWVSV